MDRQNDLWVRERVGEGWGYWPGNMRVRFVGLLGKAVSVWNLNIRLEEYASYFT